MKICYIHRNKSLGFSIATVFSTTIASFEKKYDLLQWYLPSKTGSPKSIFNNLKYIWNLKKEIKPNIFHITGDVHYIVLALLGCKTIVTVHDVGLMRTLKNPKRLLYSILRIKTLKLANKVVFISNFTKNEVLKYTNLDRNKIAVIPNPVSKGYTYMPKKINTDCPRILHIGTGTHKNLKNTILAIKDMKCHLRIIGKINDEMKQLLLHVGIAYSNEFNLSDAEIIQEYEACDIVNFPSFHEGFGMPIIEGQATGRIVITSNLEPMKEVAGEGAVLVDPNDISDLKFAYLKIISDTTYRKEIIEKGLKNVKRFSVEKINFEYDQLYSELNAN